MTRTRKIILFVTTIVLILLGLVFYKFKQFSNTLDEIGPCALNVGPCNGRQITLDQDSVTVDQHFDIPNGRLALSRTTDTLPPILFKTDESNKVVWAIELKTGTKECGIPCCKLTNIKLSTDDAQNKIFFFNGCYSEPGTIYLTEDFDFNYMCLSPM